MLLALWALPLISAPAQARHELLQLFVAEPYLELHTGPGRGYPVTQVVARGESVDVLFRRTDWFKVRTETGVTGWAAARELSKTRLADGTVFQVNLGDLAQFASHRWESGVFAGDYHGATLIAAKSATASQVPAGNPARAATLGSMNSTRSAVIAAILCKSPIYASARRSDRASKYKPRLY